MTTGLLDLKVEDYSSRSPSDAGPPAGEKGGEKRAVTVSVPALLALSLLFTAFVAVAVALSQVAGAC